jgi:hypothetical protein
MVKRKIIFGIAFVLFALALNACVRPSGSTGFNRDTITGTEGLIINFLPGNPQESYLVYGDEPISVILEVKNKGAYPSEDEENLLSRGQAYLSGFDETIIIMEENSKRLNREFLTGVSYINPEGSVDVIEFKGDIIAQGVIVDKYTPTILATVCYPYITKASPSVCIDPFPYDEKQKKVCKIGSQTLPTQGAPIAITRIDQEASSSKMQFKISIKNVGGGDALSLDSLENCNPFSGPKLNRKDFDKVEMLAATAGPFELDCGPFVDGRNIRLSNGEGFVICSLKSDSFIDAGSAYTTPLNLRFRYGYRSTITKPITISRIAE